MKSKHVAFIGATGQVGTPLTTNLLAGGHRVRVIVRSRGVQNLEKEM